jgi:Ca2+-binding RTX toxin-like protein
MAMPRTGEHRATTERTTSRTGFSSAKETTMIQSTTNVAIDLADEADRLGPLVVRFLMTGDDAHGPAGVPTGRRRGPILYPFGKGLFMRRIPVRLAVTGLVLAMLATLTGPVRPVTATGVTVACGGKPITIFATGGTTRGTSGNDVIQGSLGDDVIDGRGGNDFICDSGGTNLIDGGAGDDAIGGVGTLQGGAGNDDIRATDPGSVADGGSGNDLIIVTNGADAIGGSGNDDITARFGASGTVNGGSGNDRVFGIGVTAIAGGSGADRLVAGTGVSLVDCGSGTDSYDVFPGALPALIGCEREFAAG